MHENPHHVRSETLMPIEAELDAPARLQDCPVDPDLSESA